MQSHMRVFVSIYASKYAFYMREKQKICSKIIFTLKIRPIIGFSFMLCLLKVTVPVIFDNNNWFCVKKIANCNHFYQNFIVVLPVPPALQVYLVKAVKYANNMQNICGNMRKLKKAEYAKICKNMRRIFMKALHVTNACNKLFHAFHIP